MSFQDPKYIKIFENFLKIGDAGYLGYIEKECVHRSWAQSNNQTVDLPLSIPYKLKDNEIFIKGNQIYKSCVYYVAVDYSQLAFFAVAGVLNGNIKCLGLNHSSLQGDKAIINILKNNK